MFICLRGQSLGRGLNTELIGLMNLPRSLALLRFERLCPLRNTLLNLPESHCRGDFIRECLKLFCDYFLLFGEQDSFFQGLNTWVHSDVRKNGSFG